VIPFALEMPPGIDLDQLTCIMSDSSNRNHNICFRDGYGIPRSSIGLRLPMHVAFVASALAQATCHLTELKVQGTGIARARGRFVETERNWTKSEARYAEVYGRVSQL